MPQGWMFVVLISALNLIFAFISILGGSSWEAFQRQLLSAVSYLSIASCPALRKPLGSETKISVSDNSKAALFYIIILGIN